MKTSSRQISLFTEVKSTSSQGDSLVNHTPQQENEKERMMNAIYGRRCCDAFRKCNHVGSWAKTFSDLLIGQGDWYSRKSNLIWKLKGTKFNRIFFQLYPKTLRTEEIGFGLLPTVMAQSRETDVEKTLERKEKYGGMKRAMYLENYAAMGMLPTPQASEGTKIGGTENQDSLTKRPRYGVLPTPKGSDSKGSGSKESLEQRNRGENNDLSSWATLNTDGKNAKLNPQFVAEMMGFPNKWTEKPFEEDAENSFDAVDFNKFPTSYPIVQEEFQPNGMTHSKWRRESIKGYGNAVVPQVVLEIFKAIEKYDKFTKS